MTTTRHLIVLRGLVPLVTAMALLAGCSLGPGTAPTASVAPSASAPGAVDGTPGDGTPDDHTAAGDGRPTGADVRSRGIPVTAGGVTITVLGQDVTPTAAPDGSVTVTATVPLETTVIARIALAEGLTAQRLMDGSVVLHDPAGTPVGGLSAPDLTAPPLDAPGDLASTAVHLALSTRFNDTDLIDVVLTPATTSAALTVSVQLGAVAIASTTWGEREGGRSLAVVPSDWLRGGSLAAQQVGWSQLVAAVPEAETATMRDQFDCHALGARDKASWNLEPWRPDVGSLAVLAALCNPT